QRPVSVHVGHHGTSSHCDGHDCNDHGGGGWDTHPELPQARPFPPRKQRRWVQTLNEPGLAEAYRHPRGDDPVIGLYLNHQARALPWWIMKNHHVANLAFEHVPVLVTLCEMCSGSSAFRAEVQGRRLTFRMRGQYNGTILLEDGSTKTMW